MATHDYIISNASGASVRADLNNALAAIVSNNSNATSPATTYAYQWWADTTTGQLKLRNSANSAWITIFELDGTMLMEDGTVSAPGLAFASDLNTGFFRSAADKINFATGGAERLEIGSSEVVFNDPSNDVDFRVESNGNANMLFVDAGNDRVGVGTNSPAVLLDVADSSGNEPKLRMSTGTATNFLQISRSSSTGHYTLASEENGSSIIIATDPDGTGAVDRLAVDRNGKVGVGLINPGGLMHLKGDTNSNGAELILAVNNNNTTDNLGAVLFGNNVSTNLSKILSGSSGNNTSSYLTFSTSASGSQSEAMRIDSSQRLLVGTTTEGEASADDLTVASSANTGITIRSGSTSPGSIYFSDGTSGDAEYRGFIDYNHDGDYLRFASAASERLRIDSSGNVGIGRNSASSRLHIATSVANASSPAGMQIGNDGSGSNTGASISLGAGNAASSTAGNIAGFYDGTGTALSFSTSNSFGVSAYAEKARIDSSGRLGVGISSPVAQVQINSDKNAETNKQQGGNYHLMLKNDQDDTGEAIGLAFSITSNASAVGAAILHERDGGGSQGSLQFLTNEGSDTVKERMRIKSTGQLSMFDSGGFGHVIESSRSASTSDYLIFGRHSSTSITGTGGTHSFAVYTNGNVQNTNNSYGAISDAKLKENIVDASSQWDDIKDLRVRNYNFIEGQTHTQIGVVAQEVETVSPGLVSESPDTDDEGNDLGTVTKSVNYSVLYMKAVKALQEAMDRIETLEAKVAALEAS